MFIASAESDPVTMALALLGGGLGLFVGEKIRQRFPSESTAPLFCCFIGAVLAGVFAYVVLSALIMLTLLLGTVVILWHTKEFWKNVLNHLGLYLSAFYIKHYAARILRRKTATLDREHANRVQAILDMDVDDRRQTSLLESENERHERAIEKLYPLNPNP